jgi:hypothetical protein
VGKIDFFLSLLFFISKYSPHRFEFLGQHIFLDSHSTQLHQGFKLLKVLNSLYLSQFSWISSVIKIIKSIFFRTHILNNLNNTRLDMSED